MLKPTFALTIGALTTSTDNPVAGPQHFSVARDMDVAADSLQLWLMARADVALADAVTLQLGHDGEQETVFTGHVVQLQPTLAGVGVTALGSMAHLLRLRTATWYEEQSAGNIARDLIDQAGLTAGVVDAGPTLPRFAVDRRQSAYAQLKGLANRLGFELYAKRDGAIHVHGLGESAGLDSGGGLLGAATSAVSDLFGGGGEGYHFGQHLLQGGAIRRPPAWERVVVGGESPMSGQGDSTAHWLTTNDADYRGEAGAGDATLLVLDPAARTKDLADRFAAGLAALAKRTAHQVAIRVLGRPQLDLGDTITIGGAPDELISGDGYIRALHHRFDTAQGFVTDLPRLREGGMSDRLLAIIQRVVQTELAHQRTALLGVVTAIFPHEAEDDENNYEVNVRLKHEDLELRRAPLAASYLGMASPPRIGDLVLVHFLNGDLNQPVVTGRFYHADNRPPLHKADEILFEQRLADDTFNHLRLAADGAIFIQRNVTQREDNNAASAGVKIDPDGNIEIKSGDKITLTLNTDGSITIACESLMIDGAVEISKTLKVGGDTTVDTQLVVGTGPKTTIKGGEIQGG